MMTVRLCLTGDVMCGRGIDQILGHPGDPAICESWVRSALDYVELAEARAGPIRRRVPPTYVWGDMLTVLRHAGPDALTVNLETAVTDQGSPWPGKGIHHRMHPTSPACRPQGSMSPCWPTTTCSTGRCPGWSRPSTTRDAGITAAGAGRSDEDAWAPAIVDLTSGPRASRSWLHSWASTSKTQSDVIERASFIEYREVLRSGCPQLSMVRAIRSDGWSRPRRVHRCDRTCCSAGSASFSSRRRRLVREYLRSR